VEVQTRNYPDEWYPLHPRSDGEEHSYTGSLETREEALANYINDNPEVLTAKQLVARLAERARKH
jgi:hypothetical protein